MIRINKNNLIFFILGIMCIFALTDNFLIIAIKYLLEVGLMIGLYVIIQAIDLIKERDRK